MIVGYCFLDDNVKIARQQHDVYDAALGIIAGECIACTRQAALLPGIEAPKDIESVSPFDHRTLQYQHDQLAAAWRYRLEAIRPQLPFGPPHAKPVGAWTLMDAWCAWLREEVRSWRDEPMLIRYVMLILQHQNEEIGKRAEDALIAALYERFSDVPWLASHREVHSEVLKRAVPHPALYRAGP